MPLAGSNGPQLIQLKLHLSKRVAQLLHFVCRGSTRLSILSVTTKGILAEVVGIPPIEVATLLDYLGLVVNR